MESASGWRVEEKGEGDRGALRWNAFRDDDVSDSNDEPITRDPAAELSAVVGTGRPRAVAEACIDALRVHGGPVRLRASVAPIPVEAGDAASDLDRVLVARTGRLTVELFARTVSPFARGNGAARVRRQLERIWGVQDALLEQEAEINKLTFSLNSIEQVARTISGAHSREAAGSLLADSVREVLFAWWAALYQEETPGGVLKPVAVHTIRRLGPFPDLPGNAIDWTTVHAGLVPEDSPLHAAIGHEVSAGVHIAGSTRRLLLVGESMTGTLPGLQEMELLQTITEIASSALAGADLLDRLQHEALMDPLTGCLNRRGLEQRLQVEAVRARRYHRPLSILMLDLDRFKQVNDLHGHAAGDRVLSLVGRALRTTLRETDLLGRYGGEEFAIGLPEVDAEQAIRAGERVRHALAGITDPASPEGITASFGISTLPADGTDPAMLLQAADRALYLAKAAGGDRIVSAAPLP